MKKTSNLLLFGLTTGCIGALFGIIISLMDNFMQGNNHALLGVLFFAAIAVVGFFVAKEYYDKVKEEIKG